MRRFVERGVSFLLSREDQGKTIQDNDTTDVNPHVFRNLFILSCDVSPMQLIPILLTLEPTSIDHTYSHVGTCVERWSCCMFTYGRKPSYVVQRSGVGVMQAEYSCL